MSDTEFSTAVKFLTQYRAERVKSLNNEQVQGWATTPVSAVKDLVDVFKSTATNDQWSAEYEKTKKNDEAVGADKIQFLRAGINFLSGCRRDVRIQYAAGTEHRVRLGPDYNRFEYSRLAYVNYTMDLADKVMTKAVAE